MSVRGNSNTATKLKTARNIKLQGAVSGSANFDGSNNVTINTVQNNVCVIEGQIELKANEQENLTTDKTKQTLWEISFPSGYNKDNCVCIAFGTKSSTGKNYAYGMSDARSTAQIRGTIFKSVVLGATSDNTKISCEAWNFSTEKTTIYYKIVLMKIS